MVEDCDHCHYYLGCRWWEQMSCLHHYLRSLKIWPSSMLMSTLQSLTGCHDELAGGYGQALPLPGGSTSMQTWCCYHKPQHEMCRVRAQNQERCVGEDEKEDQNSGTKDSLLIQWTSSGHLQPVAWPIHIKRAWVEAYILLYYHNRLYWATRIHSPRLQILEAQTSWLAYFWPVFLINLHSLFQQPICSAGGWGSPLQHQPLGGMILCCVLCFNNSWQIFVPTIGVQVWCLQLYDNCLVSSKGI